VERGTRMIMEATGLGETEARNLLIKEGSVRNATKAFYLDKGQTE